MLMERYVYLTKDTTHLRTNASVLKRAINTVTFVLHRTPLVFRAVQFPREISRHECAPGRERTCAERRTGVKCRASVWLGPGAVQLSVVAQATCAQSRDAQLERIHVEKCALGSVLCEPGHYHV